MTNERALTPRKRPIKTRLQRLSRVKMHWALGSNVMLRSIGEVNETEQALA